MDVTQVELPKNLKEFFEKVVADRLFVLASSVSFYSALAIAPFLIILLSGAALIGLDVHNTIVQLSYSFSSEVGQVIQIIFNNVNEGVDLSSSSGLIAVVILLSTSSLVFLQLRYSMDQIYGYKPMELRTFWKTIVDKLFAMAVVLLASVFLIVSSSIPGLMRAFLEGHRSLLFF